MVAKEEVDARLSDIIKGLNLIPTMLKELKEELKKHFEENTMCKIINSEIDYSELTSDEYQSLLSIVYDITKDEKLNADNININYPDDKSVTNDENLYYNFNNKINFANTYNSDETIRVTMAMFRRSYELEKELNKDLFNFNVMELEKFFKTLECTTLRSLQNYISKVERYTDFAIENNLKEDKINFASVFDKTQRIESLLDKDAIDNLILSKEEIMNIAMNADNAQDGVVIALLFDGVSLKNNFEELINLKINKFDEKNSTLTTEEGRVISLSRETAILVKHASKQSDTYVSITGKTHRTYKVAEGKNVLRGLRGRSVISPSVVGQRIARLAQVYDYNYMNATNISYSGQLYMVNELMKEGVDINEAVEITLENFDIPKNKSSIFYLKTKVINQ